jgi:hypothetical protein
MSANTVSNRFSVTASTTVVTLFPVGTRSQAMVFNDSTSWMRVAIGPGASSTSFTAKIAPQGFWECPSAGEELFDGEISGIWETANGSARCTEVA